MVAEKNISSRVLLLPSRLIANLVTAAVPFRVVGDCPSGILATRDNRRHKTTVRILANDFDLLLVAADVIQRKGMAG